MPPIHTRDLEPLAHLHDFLQFHWEHHNSQRRLSLFVLATFLFSLLLIEAKRQGFLFFFPDYLIPSNHVHAINIAFSLILIVEVVGLIFALPCSFSRSVGHQLEIISLILLRDAFKELAHLPEPIRIDYGTLLNIGATAVASLCIFACLGFYRHMRQSRNYLHRPVDRMSYIIAKKVIALLLFAIFACTAVYDGMVYIVSGKPMFFFETMYTVLVFADIAIMLIAQRYMPSYYAVFRNSSFVIATLMLRLSLSATLPWSAAACVFAALYILGITFAINRFDPPPSPRV